MKKLISHTLSWLIVISLAGLMGCPPKPAPAPDVKTQKIGYLKDKTGGWTGSVSVPVGSATTADQWTAFKAVFTETNITTSGYPTGCAAVWPSGAFTVNSDVTQITRTSDGVVMQVTSLTATSLTVRFTVPDGVVIGGRVQVLSGEYTFTLQ
jgi:hypothetical protein